MKRPIQKEIEALKIDTAIIRDSQTKNIFNGLLNLTEKLYAENEQLKEDNQKLKDEINHLKGEQGKPDIKERNRNSDDDSDTNSDHSSEKERKGKGKDKKGRNREPKLPKIKIDREQVCPVDT